MYVADDHPMFLEAILDAIRDHPELELVGSAAGGRDAGRPAGHDAEGAK